MRTTHVHAVFGSIAVTIGFWLVWGELPVVLVAVFGLAAAGFLAWQGTTIAHVWAWTCLLLGFASAAWPIATMVQVRMGAVAAAEPSDEQMGMMLTAVVAGLFSSVFWTSFAFGIFRWIKRQETDAAAPSAENTQRKRR